MKCSVYFNGFAWKRAPEVKGLRTVKRLTNPWSKNLPRERVGRGSRLLGGTYVMSDRRVFV